MMHSFDADVACKVGVNAAIVFQNIGYICEYHKTNESHFHEGRYWMFNTRKAFMAQYQYLTEKQVRLAIEKLVEAGLVMKGNFNGKNFDRTSWYALTDEGQRIFRVGPTRETIRANTSAPEGQAIPLYTNDINSLYRDIEDIRAREDNPFGYGEGDTPKIDTVQKYAANVLQTLSMRAMQELNDFVDELGEDVCWHGIDNALDNGKRVWAYVRSILNTYADEGVKTVADAKAYDAKRHQRPSVAEKPAAPVDPDAFVMPPNQAGDGGLSYFKRDGRYYRLLKSGRTEQVPETRSDGTPFDPTIPWVRERLIEYDGPLNPKPVLQD